MEDNSISIVNRTGATLTGEKAQALPIRLTGTWSWTRYVAVGFVLALAAMIFFMVTIKKQVVAVEVSGKAEDFQLYQIQ
jgi:hypothetical protein